MRPKFIFVTGGVLSSLGKGLASASMGTLLEARGLNVNFIKLDPYINVDPGTMNPYQHGEVYVTRDGAEADLDLGHYERFTLARMTKDNNVTSGKIYFSVLQKERKGDYLGDTVQVIPHITDEIKRSFFKMSPETDIVIVEIGGTVGDIESLPFLEAARQMRGELGAQNVLFVHVTLVPYIETAKELKTKPTQHSVKELREIGIQPDILLCRTNQDLPPAIKDKIALFTNVEASCVITAKDVECIYEVPLLFGAQKLDERIIEKLSIWTRAPKLEGWRRLVERFYGLEKTLSIGMVGKYMGLTEAYKSLSEALVHAGIQTGFHLDIRYIDSERLEETNAEEMLEGLDGIVVPGGFGQRGILGMLAAIKNARLSGLPFFGICLGMQLAIVEFARNELGLEDANSEEFDPNTPYPVIALLEEQKSKQNLGGTMRLGAYPCRLSSGSLSFRAYGKEEVYERHRHRYEVNPEYRSLLEERGLRVMGRSPDGLLVEVVELTGHPWFVGCQFHPEFESKPLAPHPLFVSFLEAAGKHASQRIPG
jgi:CTP synthase